MKRSLTLLCLGLLGLFPSLNAYAEDVQLPKPGFLENDLPEKMKPWSKWVLSDYKPNHCPFLYTNFQQKSCIWPGDLSLKLTSAGGDFLLKATLYDEGWLMLPGQTGRWWPQQVRAGQQQKLIVNDRNGFPQVFLQAGTYTITGTFSWDELPETLMMPENTGMVHVEVDGQDVSIPTILNDNRTLLIKHKETTATETERTDVKVFRHITDSIPMTVDTRIVVNVSGKPREVVLGKVLLDDFVPMDIDSAIPARIEPDGRLRLQVRPGTWEVNIQARHNAPVTKLALPKEEGDALLAKEEIWVFEPMSYLRLVQIEGVTPIDPAQTELPRDWRGFPAYYLKPGDVVTIAEKKRGNIEPAPDQLNLSKEWWLDFDGSGYTVRDQINGQISQSWRLEVQPGVGLGHAAINGRDQFITQLANKDGKGDVGIEVRPGPLNLEADSRIEKTRGTLSATGWKHDFLSVQGTLHLPPGWKIFYATGADSVSDSWIQRWTLLDIFMVLIILIVTQRLFGARIAAITAPGFVLLHHPFPELTSMGLIILAAVALLKVLPRGKFRGLVIWARRITLFLLLIAALPFMVQHMRQALFPQLATYDQGYYNRQPMAVAAGVPSDLMGVRKDVRRDFRRMEKAKGAMLAEPEEMADANKPVMALAMPMLPGSAPMPAMAPPPPPAAPPPPSPRAMQFSSAPSTSSMQEVYQYAPGMQSNTGFGIVSWQGMPIRIYWNGPVTSKQELHLWLMSPGLNLFLAVARILLLAYIMVVLLGVKLNKNNLRDFPVMAAKAFSVMMALWLASGTIAPAHAEDFPTPQLLEEMKTKLTREMEKPPTCLPGCASLPKAKIDVKDDQLSIIQEIHTSEGVMVPLPGPVASWRPSTIVLADGNITVPVRSEQDGYLYIYLDRGVHQVQLSGKLPSNQDVVNLSFPLGAHSMEASGSGWGVEGIRPNGENTGNIQLVFTGKREQQQEATLEKNKFPAFIEVERTISFGLSWEMTTVIHRLTPLGQSINVGIPLLAGESVLDANLPVKDGKAVVSMGPQMESTSWLSRLSPSDTLTLKATPAADWPEFISGNELWRFNISNLWHVTFEGIPSVKEQQAAGINYTNAGQAVEMPAFAPWPGETLQVHVLKPEGVAGQTVTIDRSRMDITSGARSLEGGLELTLRASQGGQHIITLPVGAVLSGATLGGVPTSLSVKDNSVTLPLSPGSQTYRISWTQPKEIEPLYRVPAVNLSLPSVNSEIALTLPQDRWLLFISGPQMGPAVLFWGWIPVILLAAFALGKIELTPLRFRHWLLLLLGLTQTSFETNFIVVGWLIVLGGRKAQAEKPMSAFQFNAQQILIGLWTLVSIATLFSGIEHGLLGSPDMRIQGNGSTPYLLQWYQDIVTDILPQPLVFSLPIFCYRVLMLVWALWLAFALVRWLQWGWKCFSAGGYWRRDVWKKPPAVKPGA